MSEGKEVLVKEGIDQGTVDAARALESDKYAEGFVTDIEMELAPKGLNEDTVRYISAKKEEPEWMLQLRLEAFQRWKEMIEPTWAMINYPKIDYQDAHYYAEPKGAAKYKTIDDVPKEILETYAKLGIPLREQEVLLGVEGALGSAAATARETPPNSPASRSMPCSIASASRRPSARNCEGRRDLHVDLGSVREHPELVKQYLGTVVPVTDNFFATLNSAVFSDGTFVYVP
jgi:Fe-S cluster assembly protein SufB